MLGINTPPNKTLRTAVPQIPTQSNRDVQMTATLATIKVLISRSDISPSCSQSYSSSEEGDDGQVSSEPLLVNNARKYCQNYFIFVSEISHADEKKKAMNQLVDLVCEQVKSIPGDKEVEVTDVIKIICEEIKKSGLASLEQKSRLSGLSGQVLNAEDIKKGLSECINSLENCVECKTAACSYDEAAAAVRNHCRTYFHYLTKLTKLDNTKQFNLQDAIFKLIVIVTTGIYYKHDLPLITVLCEEILDTPLASLEYKNATRKILRCIENKNFDAIDNRQVFVKVDHQRAVALFKSDEKKAMLTLDRLAELGHAPSLIFVAKHTEDRYNKCYIKSANQGLYKKALNYFKQAEAGKSKKCAIEGKLGALRMTSEHNVEARYELGMLYLIGIPGVLGSDIAEAVKHLKIAADASYGPAMASRLFIDKSGKLTVAEEELGAFNERIKLLRTKGYDLTGLNENWSRRALIQKPGEQSQFLTELKQFYLLARTALNSDFMESAGEISNLLCVLIMRHADLKSNDSDNYVIPLKFIIELAELFEAIDYQIREKSGFSGNSSDYIKKAYECYGVASKCRSDERAFFKYTLWQADQGNADSQYTFALRCKNKAWTISRQNCNEAETARRYFKMAADQGHVGALVEMACDLLDKEWSFINQNEKQTLGYLNKITPNLDEAAKKSYRDTFFDQAEKHRLTNPTKAQLCYEKAAELGHDVAKCLVLMRKAHAGDGKALAELGTLCIQHQLPSDPGFNGIRNEQAGYRYLQQAADKGDGEAALKVARYYAKQNEQSPAFWATAKRYFKMAVQQKVEGAEASYELFKEVQMDAELERADKLGVVVKNTDKKPKEFDAHTRL